MYLLCDAAKPMVARSVYDLQLDALVLELYGMVLLVHTHRQRRDDELSKTQLVQQTTLTDPRLPG